MRKDRGFSLLELMTVIAIIAVVMTVGTVSYMNTTKNISDTKRKTDIDTIAKAYEAIYDEVHKYRPLQDSDFGGGKIPTPPRGGSYSGFLTSNASTFQICAALSGNLGETCNSPSATCYCRQSQREPYVAFAPEEPTPTPTSTPRPTPTRTPTPTPTSTPTPTPSPTPTPTPVPSGSGLVGGYFATNNLSGLAIPRTDNQIDFNWGTGSPGIIPNVDYFSVRWTGYLKTGSGGTYTFYTTADDGFKLYIGDMTNPFWNRWWNNVGVEQSTTKALTANTTYSFKLEYYDNWGNALIQLRWMPPGGTKTIIPAANFSH